MTINPTTNGNNLVTKKWRRKWPQAINGKK